MPRLIPLNDVSSIGQRFPRGWTLGFTGSEHSVPQKQLNALQHVLSQLRDPGLDDQQFHHGDCIGADDQAGRLAHGLGYQVHIHPPIIEDKRAFSIHHFAHPAAQYLTRNGHIADRAQILLAAPDTIDERLRSGTWATVRYARQRRVPAILVFPDGTARVEVW